MPGFDVVVRVARLALESSAEGVEVLERSVTTAASAYGVEVDLVVLPSRCWSPSGPPGKSVARR